MNVYHPMDEIWGGGCQSLGLMRMFAGDSPVSEVIGWVRITGSTECPLFFTEY
jgi:hypothetical protein